MKKVPKKYFEMPTKRSQDLLDLRHSPDKKVSKPLMEKRRRARINHSLAQLKALVIDPNTAEKSRQAKLEKADILELTVQHLHEIQRQQRTTQMLDVRHPKRKFEVGYSECAREVELFMSNFVDPQCPGLDGELPRRLKDHLFKRLNDFKSLSTTAVSETESSAEAAVDSSRSESSANPEKEEDLPVSMDCGETDPSDVSPLRKMLTYYSDRDAAKENLVDNHFGNQTSSNYKRNPRRTSKRDKSGLPHSCQSVSSTTGIKFTGERENVDHLENNCLQEPSRPSRNLTETQVPKRAPPGIVANTKPARPSGNSISPPVGQSPRDPNLRILEQIPLVPRQLANGDWALVLPASLVPTKDEDSHPISAFRLVLPSHSNASDPDCDHSKLGQSSVSSPLSSGVSDLSAEEYCARFDSDSVERMEHGSPDSTQSVWRPW